MPPPWPTTPPTAEHRAAYADAVPRSYWLDALPTQPARETLEGRVQADLCIVGGGYTGLWAALAAKERDPGREVVLLEATRCAGAASGRNGGFVSASLTHGLANGLTHFPGEIEKLERLGLENFAQMRADIARLKIDCGWEETGELEVAVSPHELLELPAHAELLRRHGHEVALLDGDELRAEVRSPVFLGGLWDRTGHALVDPGRLGRGLAAAAERAGVRIYERSPARSVRRTAAGMTVSSEAGVVEAERVLLASGAHPALLRSLRLYVAPVYDYVLMTEPLDEGQQASIGWERRQGLADMANQFHYFRRSADGRILWGGYDAVYRYGGDVGPHRDEDGDVFARLSQHFFTAFPQLEGVRFSHRWGGAIDTCSRFSLFLGTAHGRRVAYAMGYTGLGVGATRFGGRTALDLLDGRDSDATRLQLTRRRPVPFPPEPLRNAVIQLTRSRLAAADRDDGRRGLWLRALDAVGLGFDS